MRFLMVNCNENRKKMTSDECEMIRKKQYQGKSYEIG